MSDSTPSYFKSIPDALPVRKAKTAIVTGTSSGIGLRVSEEAGPDWQTRVIATMYRMEQQRPGLRAKPASARGNEASRRTQVEVSQENKRIHNFQLIALREELCLIAKGKFFSQLYQCSKNRGKTITRVFYRLLFEEHPELASTFNAQDKSDGSQARRLAAAVLAYASNVDRLHKLERAITSIGRKHVSLNVLPELEQKSQSSLAHQEGLATESQNGFLRRPASSSTRPAPSFTATDLNNFHGTRCSHG